MGRLNFLLITADDMAWDTPGCYGGQVPEITPNIDRLASEGICFKQAHVTVAACQPSRQALMTGQFPHLYNTAESGGFTPIAMDTPTLPEILGREGYINGCIGKAEHLQPTEKYDWTLCLDIADMKMGRSPKMYYERTKEFLEKAKKRNRPFFLMANTHDPHKPYHGSDEEKGFEHLREYMETPSRVYSPDEVQVPGFMPDTPELREEMAQYFSSAKRCDDSIGMILKAVKDAGCEGETVIMFLSDNGIALPFAKFNCYLHSTKTPWIVKWPNRIDAGTVDDANFISGIDYMPTVLDIAGIDCPEGVNGSSFRSLLEGKDSPASEKEPERSRVHTCFYQTIAYMPDEIPTAVRQEMENNGFEYRKNHRPRHAYLKDYHMRCVQIKKYGYIYNQWSGNLNAYGACMSESIKESMMRVEPERLEFYKYRCPEELYDFEEDPDARKNLACIPEHRGLVESFRKSMIEWMTKYQDRIADDYIRFCECE